MNIARLLFATFDALPKNPHTRRYEPAAQHKGAPTAAAAEIVGWTRAVAGGR